MSRSRSIDAILARVGKSSRKPPTSAKGRVRSEKGKMNGLEADYAAKLEADPSVLWWKYDAIKLRIAPDTFYVPDFLVLVRTGDLEVHEVKGHWEDDARVKIKVAASIYPFFFLAVQRVKGEWTTERFD